jgi:hypothetical protein
MMPTTKNQASSHSQAGSGSSPQKEESYSGADSSTEEWEIAQERVLLYLKILHVSGNERLTLALEALNRAKSKVTESGAIPAAMHAVKELLSEQSRARCGTQPSLPSLLGSSWNGLHNTPPLNRGFIAQCEFDHTTVWTIFMYLVELFLKAIFVPVRLLFQPVFLLLMLFLFLSLFWAFVVQ